MILQINKDQIHQYIGKDREPTKWITIDQEQINRFADDTWDHQFIHVDEERAKASPFNGTIVHGMYVLSLLPHFYAQNGIGLADSKMSLNYGFDKVRFLAPVPVNSQLRGKFLLHSVVEKKPGQLQMCFHASVEIQGSDVPALIAEWLVLVFI